LPDVEEDDEEDQGIAAHLEAELQKGQAAFQRILEGGALPAAQQCECDDDDGAAAAAAAKEERRRARQAARVGKREKDEAWAQQTATDLAAGDQQLAARMTADLLLARGVCAGEAGSTAPQTLRDRNTDTREKSSAGEWEQRRSEKRGEEEELKCSRGSKHTHGREEMRGARHSSKARGQRAAPLPGDMESRIAADLQLAQRHQQRLVASV
jgi:hypothetical protein